MVIVPEEIRRELRKLINNGVKYATELGMYVIIDWHILSDGNPAKNKKQAISFFKYMAKKYKNQNNIFYEICNEPNGGTSWKQDQRLCLICYKNHPQI